MNSKDPQQLWQKRSLDLPDCLLSFETRGSGDPVVLLHGFTRTGRSHWNDDEVAFLADYQLIVPDLPGHGLSRYRGSDFTHAMVAAIIRSMCVELGLSRAHFVGFSCGGMSLYYLALTSPDLIQTMTCIASGIRIEPVTQIAIAQACSPLTNPDYHQIVSQLNQLHEPGQGPGYGQLIMDQWQQLTAAGRDPDLSREDLARLTRPLLIVHGEQDPIFPLAQAREVRAVAPDSRLLVLRDTGHFINNAAARSDLQRELLAFLAAHSSF